MKKTISIFLCLALLLCICSFSGCNKDKKLSATGEYNGQKITMSYEVLTDIPYVGEMRSLHQINGYICFRDYSNGEDKSAYNAMDTNGNVLFNKVYDAITPFDKEGWCAVRESSGDVETYFLLHADGESHPITEAEYQGHSQQFYTTEPIYPPVPQGVTPPYAEYACLTGPLYNGLAVYVDSSSELKGKNNHLMGICDESGNIIIRAFIPICHDQYMDIMLMNEDVIVFNDNGKIAIAKIVRE